MAGALSRKDRRELARLEAVGLAPLCVRSAAERLAWALLIEGIDRLRHSGEVGCKDFARSSSYAAAVVRALRNRAAEVAECVNRLEGISQGYGANAKIPIEPRKQHRTNSTKSGLSLWRV